MCDRIKQIRLTLGLTQSDFGSQIGLSQAGISALEKGIRNITDRNIQLICEKFNANEEWLRNGEGEMFLDVSEEDDFIRVATQLRISGDESVERLKSLRKALNLKQCDFAKKISTTQGHISDIENGRKKLSSRTIKLICLQDWNGKKVNEDYLIGLSDNMFLEFPEENEFMKAATELMLSGDRGIMRAVIAYWKMSPEQREFMRNFMIYILDPYKKE